MPVFYWSIVEGITLEWILGKQGGKVQWNGHIWLRIGTSGTPL